MFTDLDQFIREQLERFNQGQSDINDGIGPNDTGGGGFDPFGGRISFGTGVGGLGVHGGINGTGIFSDPGNVLAQIISPSRTEVVGELINAGIVSPGTVFANPDIFVSVKDDNGEVIGEINRSVIDRAVENLPTPDISGDRPPTQTGPINQDPEVKGPTVGDDVEGPIVGDGSGTVSPPSVNPFPTRSDDPFEILNDIFNSIPGIRGGSTRTPGFNPNGGDVSDIDDLLKLPIFGGGGAEGGTASASNILTDLIGNLTNDNALSNIIDAGANFYFEDKSADAMRDANKDALEFYEKIYGDQIFRLEPFRQAGLNVLDPLVTSASDNPRARNLDGVPLPEAGRRPVTLGDPSAVNVNEFDPYNINDSRLQYIIDAGAEAINSGQTAIGKRGSGDTLVKLQEMGQQAALGRAGEIQAIESARDGLDLASQNQNFSQTTTNAGLTHQLNEDDFIRSLVTGDTDFNRKLTANNFDINANNNEFGKLFEVSRLGSSAAAGQGAGSTGFGVTGSDLISANGQIKGANYVGQGQNLGNALARFF